MFRWHKVFKLRLLRRTAFVSVISAFGLLKISAGPALCAPAVSENFSLDTGDSSHSISFDSGQRAFLVHKPAAIAPHDKVALLLAFHGGGGTAKGMPRLTDLNALADKEKIVVVYPQGIDKHWNDGRPVNDKANCDDVGFIRSLIDVLSKDPNIDPKRIYVTGMSNGGFFCERLVLEMPDKIAGAAVVVAGITKELAALEHGQSPVPMLFILGTDDPIVPFKGGGVGFLHGRGHVEAASETEKFWATHNRCRRDAVASELPVRDAKDPTRVKKTVHRPQQDGADVVFLTVDGGGHTWPSGHQYLPKDIVGRVCHQISDDDIWQFLSSPHLPATSIHDLVQP